MVDASEIARDISNRKRASKRAAFLAEAAAVLAASLDYETTLKTVANLAVPSIADWCAVDVVTEGQLERLAVANVDPSNICPAEAIRERYEDPNAPYRPAHVARTGVPAMVSPITDDMILVSARGDHPRPSQMRSAASRLAGLPRADRRR